MNKQQWLGVVVTAFAMTVMSGAAFAQASAGLRPQVFTAKHFHKTAPLREMQWKMPAVMQRIVGSRHLSQQEFTQLRDKLIQLGVLKAPGQPQLVPLLRKAPAFTTVPYVSDPALQTSKPLVMAHVFTAPIANFQGLGEPDDTDECAPPDTDIAVGRNYVVELVNCAGNPGGSTFGVFDKTGSRVLGPVPLENLWLSGVCADDGHGDGVIVYDQLAGRWVISQFAGISAPTDECIAVSETGDPTGVYYVYDFSVFPNGFADYPKIAVWPDAYYATFNVFNATGRTFDGEGFVAFNRSEMLTGNPQAQMIIFRGNGHDYAYSVLPASVDGYMPPPTGAPGIFVDYVSPYLWGTSFYALEMWQMHVDWLNPVNSTLSGPTRISVDPFNDGICGYKRACIPEPGGAAVDAIGDRLMFRLAYRNLGSHEALVVNQTVGTGATPSSTPAGIRWYELDAPAGATSATAWSVAQQGTYMPNDGLSRWMGSVAMDYVGDMALGFSSSSANQNPAVSYTGRLAGDPAGKMTQAETTLVAGAGYQIRTGDRWGDYSSMVSDPSNGCTFWYAQEYYDTTGQYLWSTQIGAFKFTNCARPTGTVQGTVTDTATGGPIADATVQLGTGVSARTDSSGNYSITDLPGSYTASATVFGYVTGSASVTMTKNQTSTQNFALTPAPKATLSGTVTDGSGHGYPLYAEIRILVPGVGRVADLWTNPQTGTYSASLPQSYTYTVSARAFFDGYHSGSATVKLNGNRTQNLALTVISACAAPGYSFVHGFGEDFNGATFPPSGWTVTNNVSGSSVVWKHDKFNYTGGTGSAALATAWGGGWWFWGFYDTSLISPAVSATSLGAGSLLEFKLNYLSDDSLDALDVDVNVDNAGWITLKHITSTQGVPYKAPGVDYKLNIGSYLSGATNFKLRWRYYKLGNYYGVGYAEIDDVVVGSCRPSAGGLIVGSVSDANTGQGLVGAMVGDNTGASTKTIENAADPKLPKGYYFLFSPAGTHTVNASRFNYSSASASISVAANGVTVKNFALGAGRFSAAPAAFDLQAMVNTQTQKTLTVTNTGTVPAHFHVVSVNTPPPTTAPGTGAPLSLIHCNAPLSPQSMVAQGGTTPDCSAPGGGSDTAAGATAWSAISDYPIPVVDNAMAADESTGLVYSFGGDSNSAPTAASYVYDPASGIWSPIATLPVPLEKPVAAVINGKAYVTAGWGASGAESQALYIYDSANDTWSTGASDPVAQGGASSVVVLNDQLYVIGGCGNACYGTTAVEVYNPLGNTWSAAGSYPHPVAWEGCGGTEGKIYCAGGLSYITVYSDGYAYDPGSNRWSAIAPLPVNAGGCSSWWGGAATATASGRLLLQDGVTCGYNAVTNQGFAYDVGSDSWSSLPDALTANYRMGSACGFYMVGGSPFDGTPAGEVLPGYNVCTIKPIPWLTMAPASGTLGTGNAAAVQLTFDGTGQAEFTTSRAYLLMPSTTPYGPKIVPLTVTWTPQPVALYTSVVADRNPVAPNTDITFNVVVKNLTTPGDGGATQVVLSFDLPVNLSYVQGGASCSVSAGVVSCALGNIAQGAEQDVTIVLKSGRAGSYQMTFTAHAREPQDNNYVGQTDTFIGKVAAPSSGGGGFGWLTLIILLGLALIGIGARSRRSGNDKMVKMVKMVKRGWFYGEVGMSWAGFRFRLGSIQRLARMLGSRWLLRKCRLFTAVAAAVIGVGFAGAASAASPPPSSAGISRQNTFVTLPLQTDAQLLTQKAKLVGPHSKSSTIKLTIGLKLRNADRLQTFLQMVQYPQSSEYHHFLTPQQFTKLYGPTTTEVNAVVSFLQRHNIKVRNVAPNRMLIHTEATTGAYEWTFKIRVNDYTLNGRSFFSTTDRPKIPLSLSGIVLNVLGLDNSQQMQPHSYVENLRGQQGPLSTAPPPSTAFFNPEQIAKAYDWPAITDSGNGAGVSVAIVTAMSSGLATNNSANIFWSAYGLPSHTVNVIPVDGNIGYTYGMVETLLDMEYSGAMAPGITQNVYVASSASITTFTDAYNQFVNDDTSQVMTTSWGVYESADPAQFQTDEQIFAQAAAEGISMFAAAGDRGSGDGAPWGDDHADFPSSSEYITAANGTELSISDLSGTYASEHAWSGTGGAISQLFSQPPWQTGPGVPNSGFRMNSDMALNAGSLHPYLMYIFGHGFVGVYGTSAVAPILAGLFAIGISRQPDNASLGQSNKLIYGDVNAGNYAADFHDVTIGSNGAFSAGPGWDHPTGWGSPRATSLLSHLGIMGPEGVLMGTITDAATGLPIAGVRIAISPGNAIRHTAADGTYAILLGAGAHTVTVSDFGYGSQSQSISISDGQTITQDFGLTLTQTATLSGTVSDDSGHGYGLYSEVTVSTAGFGQVADIWTNPATGAYTDALPVGYTYTIAVHAFLDGYYGGSASVIFGGATTRDFALKVLTACTAPGYTFVQGMGEDFNGATFPPAGWTVNTPVNNGRTIWQLNTGYSDGNYTNGTGTAAEASDDCVWWQCGPYDTQLITPPIPVPASGYNPTLIYTANYRFYSQSSLDLDISTDGGSTWTNILSWNSAADDCGGFYWGHHGCNVAVQLGPYLTGATSFKLRWRYYDKYWRAMDYYAQIDDVALGVCHAVAGGLVDGTVSDANTGQGVVGATIGDDTGASTKTIENAADPNLPKGYYFLFSPAGTRKVTVSRINYANAGATFAVANNAVVGKDFMLDAGRFSAAPAVFDLQAMVNTQTQKTLTVTNTGTAPVHFDIQQVDSPSPAIGSGPGASLIAIHCNGRLSSASMAVQSGATPDCSAPGGGMHSVAGVSAWDAISDYPTPISNNTMTTDEATGLVYSFGGFSSSSGRTAASYVYHSGTNSWSSIAALPVPLANAVAGVIGGKVYVAAGWGTAGVPSQALYIYDPASDTWSTGASDPVVQAGAPGVAVLNDQLYVIGGCGPGGYCYPGKTAVEVYDPASDTWRAAAGYPHGDAWQGCGEILGRIYCAGGSVGPYSYSDGYAYDPGSNRWSAIASLPTNAEGCNDWWGGAATASASGQLLLQDGVTCHFNWVTNQGFAYDVGSDSWSSLPDALTADLRMGSACGFYMVGGSLNDTPAGEVLPGYDVCTIKPIPWLTMAPASGTLGAGNAAAVQLTFDGTGQAEFTTSRAYLLMPSTTPYGPKIVPLTVTWTPQPVALYTSVVADRNPVVPNTDITFNVVVKNLTTPGDGGATQVVLSFDLPANLSYVQGGASCSVSAGVVSCALGNIAQGAEQDVTIVLKSGRAGSYQMTFTAHAREPQDNNYVGQTDTFIGKVAAPSSGGGGGGSLGWLSLMLLLGLALSGTWIKGGHKV